MHEELDTRFLIPLLFPSLDQNLLVHLDNVIKPKEVKYSLFHIGGLKSPGFDGYPGHFFQVHWNLVGAEITNVVTQAFRYGKVLTSLNHTLITLVPKCNSPKRMHLFKLTY